MKQAIGFIDSGVGGLTVVREVLKQLPHEQVYYLGDTARCPYGPRDKEEVAKFLGNDQFSSRPWHQNARYCM